jgi:hypothetical protein
VYTGEVSQGCEGQHGISFSKYGWHQGKDDASGNYSGATGEWSENVAMAPMEKMTLAQSAEIS